MFTIYHAWFHFARFQALRRAHQRQAKLIRAQKFQQIMDQASVAASRHDSFALFQVINRFSPKQAKRRMELRNAAGSLATPIEQLAILREFVRTTWHGPFEVPMPLHVPTEMPFSIHDLEKALSTIPLTKAVARPFTPGIIWKAHASLIAPALYSVLQRWWCLPDPWIPQHWRDAWMILIPKPGKRTSAPALLRPLALQEPVGKCIVGLLAQSLQRTSYSQIAPPPHLGIHPMQIHTTCPESCCSSHQSWQNSGCFTTSNSVSSPPEHADLQGLRCRPAVFGPGTSLRQRRQG